MLFGISSISHAPRDSHNGELNITSSSLDLTLDFIVSKLWEHFANTFNCLIHRNVWSPVYPSSLEQSSILQICSSITRSISKCKGKPWEEAQEIIVCSIDYTFLLKLKSLISSLSSFSILGSSALIVILVPKYIQSRGVTCPYNSSTHRTLFISTLD